MSKLLIPDETDPLLQSTEGHSSGSNSRNYGISDNYDEEITATSPEPEEENERNESSKKQGGIIAILLLGLSDRISISFSSFRLGETDGGADR